MFFFFLLIVRNNDVKFGVLFFILRLLGFFVKNLMSGCILLLNLGRFFLFMLVRMCSIVGRFLLLVRDLRCLLLCKVKLLYCFVLFKFRLLFWILVRILLRRVLIFDNLFLLFLLLLLELLLFVLFLIFDFGSLVLILLVLLFLVVVLLFIVKVMVDRFEWGCFDVG